MENILDYDLPGGEKIYFYGEELNNKHDFMIRTNCRLNEVKYLFFFDSRGISKSYDHSLVKLIVEGIEDKVEYLLIARPLEITIWLTLFNFLNLNNIHPKKIVTNMGFVDFTPKKISIINKTVFQYQPFFSEEKPEVNLIEIFEAGSEGQMELFMHDYPKSCLDKLISQICQQDLVVINTPELDSNFQHVRPRPGSFTNAIKKSNFFNQTHFNGKTIIQFSKFDNTFTYDGVHYTEMGNNLIYKQLQKFL